MQQEQVYTESYGAATPKKQKSVQDVVGDSLFPQVSHISDVKQVIEEMTTKAANLQQEQMRAILMLQQMQKNEYLHGPDAKVYDALINMIMKDFKVASAEPTFYLDLINELIPKPPKPIMVLPSGKAVKEVSRGQ